MRQEGSGLRLEGLRKQLGRTVALKKVTANFEPGEIVGLIGPNGAGKSTLLKCLAGHLRPDRGSMALGGGSYSPRQPAAARRAGVSLVQQELALFPSLSISENWRLMRGDPLTSATAEMPRVWKSQRSTPAAQLEPAEAQRLILDAAMARSARLLLLDEPTALLDDKMGGIFLEELRAKVSSEAIAIVATHKPSDFAHLTRWLFLNEGNVVLDTTDLQVANDFFVFGQTDDSARATPRPRATTSTPKICATLSSLAFGLVDIEMAKGEAVGFTAPSGAPLYKFARSLMKHLRLQGRRVAYLGPERLADHVMPELSVEQHIRLVLGSASESSPEVLGFQRILASLGMPWSRALSASPIWTLSGGMQQKLFLALTCAKDCDVRILCDPLRGIDRPSRQGFLKTLANNSADSSVALIAQDPELMLEAAQRIAILKVGARPIFLGAAELCTSSDLMARL